MTTIVYIRMVDMTSNFAVYDCRRFLVACFLGHYTKVFGKLCVWESESNGGRVSHWLYVDDALSSCIKWCIDRLYQVCFVVL